MRETPLTDAEECEAFIGVSSLDEGDVQKAYDFARSLELQVTSLTAKLAEKEASVSGIKLWSEDVRKELNLKPGDSVLDAIQSLRSQLAEARRDSERVDAIIANKWTITWNYLRDSFIVQSKDQVCGNIGHSKPLRELLDEAALPPAPTK